MPVSVKFGAEVSNEATAELERAVRALSRAVTPEPVTVERVDHGPQNVVEWFLPPLAVISFVAGTAGSMILKGFLKEMGTEALGEQLARGVKSLLAGAAELGHWYTPAELKALAHRKEEGRRTPTLKPREPAQRSRRSPPLSMDFSGGSSADHADPPWACSFIYGWDTDVALAEAYAAMLETMAALEAFRRLRLAQIDSLLSQPRTFFGTMPPRLVAQQIESQLQELAGNTSGYHAYDCDGRRWTRISPKLLYATDSMVADVLAELSRRAGT